MLGNPVHANAFVWEVANGKCGMCFEDVDDHLPKCIAQKKWRAIRAKHWDNSGAAFRDPDVNPWQAANLIAEGDNSVVRVMLTHPRTPKELLLREMLHDYLGARSGTGDVARGALLSSTISPYRRAGQARSDDPWVRGTAVIHAHCSPKTLRWAAQQEPSPIVVAAAMANPKADAAVWTAGAHRKDPMVQMMVLLFANLNVDVLTLLATNVRVTQEGVDYVGGLTAYGESVIQGILLASKSLTLGEHAAVLAALYANPYLTDKAMEPVDTAATTVVARSVDPGTAAALEQARAERPALVEQYRNWLEDAGPASDDGGPVVPWWDTSRSCALAA